MNRPELRHQHAGPPRVVDVAEVRGLTRETWEVAGEDEPIPVDVYPASSERGVVLVGHGVDNGRRAEYITGAARAWVKRGLTIVAADAPAHGDRPGVAPGRVAADAGFGARWVRDHRRVLDAVEHRSQAPVALLGWSMGGLFGVPLLAVDHRLVAGCICIAGSTRISYRARFDDLTGDEVAALDLMDPAVFAPEVRAPVLLLNADADEIVSRESALALYDAFPGNKQLSFFPGGHVDWPHPRQWFRAMLRFFEDRLG